MLSFKFFLIINCFKTIYNIIENYTKSEFIINIHRPINVKPKTLNRHMSHSEKYYNKIFTILDQLTRFNYVLIKYRYGLFN